MDLRRGSTANGRTGSIGGKHTDTTGKRLRHAVRRADLPAVAETRRLLRDHLRRWGVAGLTDTTELLATELVTNALQHTGGGAVVTATLSPPPRSALGSDARAGCGGRLRVEVYDSLARTPPVPRASARSGRLRGDLDGPDERNGPDGPDERNAPDPGCGAEPGPADLAGAEQADLDRQGTSGRGLILVEALADAWGVQTRDRGKVVWFELAAHAA